MGETSAAQQPRGSWGSGQRHACTSILYELATMSSFFNSQIVTYETFIFSEYLAKLAEKKPNTTKLRVSRSDTLPVPC